jgi:predicted AlkP superfamily phosphohydrolase/phosphomutase
MDRLASGRCRARVVLSWPGSPEFEGVSEGLTSQAGELRCAAEACVLALTKAVKGELKLELLGVKAVRAFDANVVIVSLAVPTMPEGQRLVGCFLTPDADPSKGAALAVLNATNRILGNRFFMR